MTARLPLAEYLLVLVEVGAVGEGPGAVWTAEGSLAGVAAHVLQQGPALGEGALAHGALMRAEPRLAALVGRPRPARDEPAYNDR